MKLIARLGVLAALCAVGCHENKPAQTPNQMQNNQQTATPNQTPAEPAQPAPVQGPPP